MGEPWGMGLGAGGLGKGGGYGSTGGRAARVMRAGG